MPYSKSDREFVNAFKENFIACIQKTYDPNGEENQAQEMVQKSIKEGYSWLSRLFDTLKVPVADEAKLKRRLNRAGNIETYVKPILQDIAGIILTKDKMALRPEVIKAIGLEQYALLTGGKVTDGGEVVAKSLKSQDSFNVKQKIIAENVLKGSIIVYNEILVGRVGVKLEDVSKKTTSLQEKIEAVKKNSIGNGFNEAVISAQIEKTLAEDIKDLTSIQLMLVADTALSGATTTSEEAELSLANLMKAKQMLLEYRRQESSALNVAIITPTKHVLENFSIDELLVKSKKKVSMELLYKELNNYDDFLVNLIATNTENMSDEEKTCLDAAVNISREILKCAYEAHSMYRSGDLSKDIAMGKIKSEIKGSMKKFIELADPSSLTVKPSQTYGSALLQALTRITSIFLLLKDTYVDKAREKNDSAFLNKLHTMKVMLTPILENSEVGSMLVEDVTISRTSSMSMDSISEPSSPSKGVSECLWDAGTFASIYGCAGQSSPAFFASMPSTNSSPELNSGVNMDERKSIEEAFVGFSSTAG